MILRARGAKHTRECAAGERNSVGIVLTRRSYAYSFGRLRHSCLSFLTRLHNHSLLADVGSGWRCEKCNQDIAVPNRRCVLFAHTHTNACTCARVQPLSRSHTSRWWRASAERSPIAFSMMWWCQTYFPRRLVVLRCARSRLLSSVRQSCPLDCSNVSMPDLSSRFCLPRTALRG